MSKKKGNRQSSHPKFHSQVYQKPSRASRRPKRSWKRRKAAPVGAGYLDALDRLMGRGEGDQ